MKLSENLKEVYSQQYDESIVAWRMQAAAFKAQNIVDLSRNISFNNVLEVGSGEGSILYWLSKWGFCPNLHAIEISESGIDIIKSKQIEHLKEVLLFDGYTIPYPDKHFDLVICSHVLEHVEYERTLLREISRVSKYQIFEVPIDFSFYVDKKIKHFLSYGHINIYTPGLFRFLLLSENFTVLKDKCCLYDDSLLQRNKQSGIALMKSKLKNWLLKSSPFLLGIKPSTYAVLTQKQEKDLAIFEKT